MIEILLQVNAIARRIAAAIVFCKSAAWSIARERIHGGGIQNEGCRRAPFGIWRLNA
jgi:hypothetical protein